MALSALNIVDFWIRIFMLMILAEFCIGLYVAQHFHNPTATLTETLLFPAFLYVMFLHFVRPSFLLLADAAEDLTEGIIHRIQAFLGIAPTDFGDLFGNLLRQARIIIGLRILFGLALAFFPPPRTLAGDVPFAMAFGLALLAFWLLRHTHFHRVAWMILVAIVAIFIFGGWLEVQRKGAVVRKAAIMSGYVPDFVRNLFPSLYGKTEAKDGKNRILVMPGRYTTWQKRPSNAYLFAWDYPDEFKGMLLSDRVYVDGTRREVDAGLRESKPIELVRFRLKPGVANVKVPVKIWFVPNPDSETGYIPSLGDPVPMTVSTPPAAPQPARVAPPAVTAPAPKPVPAAAPKVAAKSEPKEPAAQGTTESDSDLESVLTEPGVAPAAAPAAETTADWRDRSAPRAQTVSHRYPKEQWMGDKEYSGVIVRCVHPMQGRRTGKICLAGQQGEILAAYYDNDYRIAWGGWRYSAKATHLGDEVSLQVQNYWVQSGAEIHPVQPLDK